MTIMLRRKEQNIDKKYNILMMIGYRRILKAF